MEIREMTLLAVGLAMNNFAISLIFGTKDCMLRWSQVLIVALLFALVQSIFITVAWQAGGLIGNMISEFDHWVAFLLLGFVSIRMLKEGKRKIYIVGPQKPDAPDCVQGDKTTSVVESDVSLLRLGKIDTTSLLSASLITLLGVAVATSIDSLGAGVAVSLDGRVSEVGWILSGIVLGVTFLFCVAGAFFGRRSRNLIRMNGWAHIAGGMILFSIALEISYKNGVF